MDNLENKSALGAKIVLGYLQEDHPHLCVRLFFSEPSAAIAHIQVFQKEDEPDYREPLYRTNFVIVSVEWEGIPNDRYHQICKRIEEKFPRPPELPKIDRTLDDHAYPYSRLYGDYKWW